MTTERERIQKIVGYRGSMWEQTRASSELVCAPDVGCGRCTGGELYGGEDQYLGECPDCNPRLSQDQQAPPASNG